VKKLIALHSFKKGVAHIALAEPVPAACCDGRMTYFVINRDGKTRCVVCDELYANGSNAVNQTKKGETKP
jgi:hypothetical protein